MHVLVTGATGFVGRAVVLRLRRDGHSVTAYVRDLARARMLLGDEAALLSTSAPSEELQGTLARCDGVINLAGEPIAPGRWSARRKARLVASRVDTTRSLVDALAACGRPPRVLVSASAVGIYGDCATTPCSERSRRGTGFLADLCEAWEGAARLAEPAGVRVVLARLGVVLGLEGGLLGQVVPLFEAGAAVGIGGDKTYVSWVHLHDAVEVLVRALGDADLHGPVNVVSPTPVPARTFWTALARQAGTSLRAMAPSWALRAALGEAERGIGASIRAEPVRLGELAVPCLFPDLEGALADLLNATGSVRIADLGAVAVRPLLAAQDPYLAGRRPSHLLQADTTLSQPLPEVFAFFCRAGNLGLMTPKPMAMQIRGEAPLAMHAGLRIAYRLRVGPVPLTWRTRIAHWEPPYAFVDAQEQGPYRSWWHEHHFQSHQGGTQMEDRVFYAPPLGPLGRLAHHLTIRRQLERIFLHRRSAITLRFGHGPGATTAAATY